MKDRIENQMENRMKNQMKNHRKLFTALMMGVFLLGGLLLTGGIAQAKTVTYDVKTAANWKTYSAKAVKELNNGNDVTINVNSNVSIEASQAKDKSWVNCIGWTSDRTLTLNLKADLSCKANNDLSNVFFANNGSGKFVVNGNSHTINGNERRAFCCIPNGNVVMENVTFTDWVGDDFYFGSFLFKNAKITNCAFTNKADSGGSYPRITIYGTGGNVSFSGCSFIENSMIGFQTKNNVTYNGAKTESGKAYPKTLSFTDCTMDGCKMELAGENVTFKNVTCDNKVTTINVINRISSKATDSDKLRGTLTMSNMDKKVNKLDMEIDHVKKVAISKVKAQKLKVNTSSGLISDLELDGTGRYAKDVQSGLTVWVAPKTEEPLKFNGVRIKNYSEMEGVSVGYSVGNKGKVVFDDLAISGCKLGLNVLHTDNEFHNLNISDCDTGASVKSTKATVVFSDKCVIADNHDSNLELGDYLAKGNVQFKDISLDSRVVIDSDMTDNDMAFITTVHAKADENGEGPEIFSKENGSDVLLCEADGEVAPGAEADFDYFIMSRGAWKEEQARRKAEEEASETGSAIGGGSGTVALILAGIVVLGTAAGFVVSRRKRKKQ